MFLGFVETAPNARQTQHLHAEHPDPIDKLFAIHLGTCKVAFFPHAHAPLQRPGVQRGTEVTNERNLAKLRPQLNEEEWSNLFGENMLRSGQ